MNKEVEDALCMLYHCARKDKEYTTQRQQFDFICNYIKCLEQQLKEKDKVIDKVVSRLKLLGKYDGYSCTRNFKMMSADFNQLIYWLERGKNENRNN